MNRLMSATILGIAILCSGCIRSLQPIYTDEDLVFEPGLVCEWSESGSQEVWTFTKDDTGGYALVYTDNEKRQGRFKAHLARLDGKLFLDLYPEEMDSKTNGLYLFHLMPVHTFMYVEQINPTLRMSYPSSDWLEKLLKTNPDAIRYESVDGEIILTADSKELQAFWLRHLGTEGAFGEQSNMECKQPGAPETKSNVPGVNNGR